MAKVLFVLAKNGFRDAEFLAPAKILEDAGYEIAVASNAPAGETALGADGAKIKVDFNFREVMPESFDLIVFVGGPRALENLDNEISYRLIKRVGELKKPLAAICVAPVILAKAGALAGKKATVWSSPAFKESIEILKKNGALYLGNTVVRDGDLITADGPAAAEEFGATLKKLLLEIETST